MLQILWLTGSDWDAPIPDSLQLEWATLRDQLSGLHAITVPRWFRSTDKSVTRLVGFCDASDKAYAAAVYFLSIAADHNRYATLIAAKSKAAPLKTVSLPRLELCGALLLAQLLSRIRLDLELDTVEVDCYSDSQVVLARLQKPPCSWVTYAANRTSQIHTLLPHTS